MRAALGSHCTALRVNLTLRNRTRDDGDDGKFYDKGVLFFLKYN